MRVMNHSKESNSHVEDALDLSTTPAQVDNLAGEEKNAEVHLKTWLLIGAINLIYFTQLVNLVGAGSLARDIASVVGGGVDKQIWFTSVVAILTTTLSIPISQAADYWGRKPFLTICTFLGFVGSIIISRANTVNTVIAGITVSSVSYGAQALLHAVISEVLPRKFRSFAQAAVNVSSSLGVIVGAYMGGALVRNGHPEHFRIHWYVTAALYGTSTLVTALFYNPPPRELQVLLSTSQKIHQLDWLGYVLLIVGLVMFCLGLSWYQYPYAFDDAHVLAPFVVGLAFMLALVIHQWVLKKDGMFHHDLFQHRTFPIVSFCSFCEGLSFYCANAFLPFQLSFYTTDPLFIGLHFSIGAYAAIVFAALGATYSWRTKSLRPPIVLGFLTFTTYNVLMATANTNTPERNLWAYPVLLGMGLGCCITPLVAVAQFATPAAFIAMASGLMISVRSLGGSIGLPIYNAVFNKVLAENLAQRIAAAATAGGLPESSLTSFIEAIVSGDEITLQEIPNATSEVIAAATVAMKDAYSIAFRYVWVTAGAFGFVGLIGELKPCPATQGL
ncbi:uncharacterized protein A1O9_07262 [Exophiala aquamarina CBS 119918]|uniref:Major facilitator superfamily (MFS) profile domain-containing protein n=1 Tax=Exophiala aquamarina CBS 119918 TaxID=1182545 RepID=A0A072PBC5_9EURO|nr:uncharacterized protein A1O9_07262 [Exophiala aquamarina CBS 119918]KEF57072.1 hypothetical protein A1O9_07262 [Exophiala aquamarina CBS 119918]